MNPYEDIEDYIHSSVVDALGELDKEESSKNVRKVKRYSECESAQDG